MRFSIEPIARAAILATALGFTSISQAQDDAYPTRPISVYVGFSPGGSTDIIARMLAPKLAQQFKQPVIVDNKPGASGTVAVVAMLRNPADGHTLLACTSSVLTTHEYLHANLPFKPDEDILPVLMFAHIPYLLMGKAALPASSAKELAQLAKEQPGKLNYASAGMGSAGHLAGLLFSERAGVQMEHVPYKGSGQAITDLAAGIVDVAFDQEASSAGFIKSGQLKPLGVASTARSGTLPDTATLIEQGIDMQAASWTGVCLKSGTPESIIRRVEQSFGRVMSDPEIKEKLLQLGVTPVSIGRAPFRERILEERETLGKLIQRAGIQAK